MRIKDLGRQEFELDAKFKEYQKIIDDHKSGKKKVSAYELSQAEIGVEFTLPQLRQVQRKLYGWRFVERVYGEEKPGLQDYLQARILDLEEKELGYQKTLSNYKTQVEMLEKLINQLINAMDPDENKLKEAKENLLDLHRQASIAEIGLPMVQKDLEEARKELEVIQEKAKKHSVDEVYESITGEINGRAKKYAEKHGVDYSRAVSEILREDPELARRYVFEV